MQLSADFKNCQQRKTKLKLNYIVKEILIYSCLYPAFIKIASIFIKINFINLVIVFHFHNELTGSCCGFSKKITSVYSISIGFKSGK